MQIDPGLKQRYSGVLSLILGIIIILIPVNVVYIIIGVTLLMMSLPNLLASANQLNTKNSFIITVFVKSLLLLILGVSIIFNPGIINVILMISGVIILVGTLLERLSYKKELKYSTSDIIVSIFGLVLIVFGGLSFIETIINIVKIVIGALTAISGLVLIISAHPKKENFEDILNDYERRYQEKMNEENNKNEEVIDVTFEENKEEN